MVKKYKKTKTVVRKIGSGRKRATTEQTDRKIYREVRKNPRTSSRILKESLNLNVSEKTIRRRLKEKNLCSYFQKKKPLLRKANIKKRLAFAKEHVNKNMSFWESIIWSNESKFELRNPKRRFRVWCKSTERLQARHLQHTVKHGGGSLMVWGCFSSNAVGNIVKIDGKMTGESYVNILNENLQPSARKMSLRRFIFQQDNDPKHTSRVAKDYYKKKRLKLLD